MIDVVLDLDFTWKDENLSIFKFSTIQSKGSNSISNITNFNIYIEACTFSKFKLVKVNQLCKRGYRGKGYKNKNFYILNTLRYIKFANLILSGIKNIKILYFWNKKKH